MSPDAFLGCICRVKKRGNGKVGAEIYLKMRGTNGTGVTVLNKVVLKIVNRVVGVAVVVSHRHKHPCCNQQRYEDR